MQTTNNSCAIVIPVYNEESAIVRTLDMIREITGKIADWNFEIICINDGSTDKTAEILKAQPGITVITHNVNRGYGAALRTGLDYCDYHDWYFIVDADGTYPIHDFPRLLEEAIADADMVVGARKGVGISAAPFRLLARWVLRKMVHILTGVMVPDLNSGMRVFRKEIYQSFYHLLPMGFSFTSTITVASLYAGYKIKYIPINYEKRVGKSNIKPFQDFLGFSMLIVRLASYFEPLRFFIPLSAFVFVVGVLKGIVDFNITGKFGSLSVVMILSAIQIFITGILADVIVRRSSLKVQPLKPLHRVVKNPSTGS